MISGGNNRLNHDELSLTQKKTQGAHSTLVHVAESHAAVTEHMPAVSDYRLLTGSQAYGARRVAFSVDIMPSPQVHKFWPKDAETF